MLNKNQLDIARRAAIERRSTGPSIGTMHRFYLPSIDISGNVIEIDDHRVIYQLTKVLRMKAGKKIAVFDENHNEYVVEILEINRRRILANQLEPIHRETESTLNLSLYQAIPKKPALFEWVIQKATEIGVSHIYPLLTQRTEKHRLSKFERMQIIAIEAAEQSRRTRIPVIHHPVNFNEVVKKFTNQVYIGYEYESGQKLIDLLPTIRQQKTVHLMIGPEGGFEQVEIDFAEGEGAHLFTLGPRILRTETAAISSLSLIMLT